MIAKERLWKTAGGNIVGEGHKDALSLLCAIGQEVPKEFRGQLNDGNISKNAKPKESGPVKNKENTGGENKGGMSISKNKGK